MSLPERIPSIADIAGNTPIPIPSSTAIDIASGTFTEKGDFITSNTSTPSGPEKLQTSF